MDNAKQDKKKVGRPTTKHASPNLYKNDNTPAVAGVSDDINEVLDEGERMTKEKNSSLKQGALVLSHVRLSTGGTFGRILNLKAGVRTFNPAIVQLLKDANAHIQLIKE